MDLHEEIYGGYIISDLDFLNIHMTMSFLLLSTDALCLKQFQRYSDLNIVSGLLAPNNLNEHIITVFFLTHMLQLAHTLVVIEHHVHTCKRTLHDY